MRFHKFKGGKNGRVLVIDLDRVVSFEEDPLTRGKTEIWLPHNVTITVDMAIDDVLALINPPAAPATFEEAAREFERLRRMHSPPRRDDPVMLDKDIRKLKDEGPGHINGDEGDELHALREQVKTIEKAARLNELERLVKAVRDKWAIFPSWLEFYVDKRRAEIERET